MNFLLFLKHRLESEFGFSFNVIKNEKEHFIIGIEGSNHSLFEVKIVITEIRLKIMINPEKNGGLFIDLLHKSKEQQRKDFCNYWNDLGLKKSKLKINEKELNPIDFINLKTIPKKFSFSYSLAPYFQDDDSELVKHENILHFVILSIKMMLSVIEYDIIGANEGKSHTQISKRYERNPLNRQLCLKLKGLNCSVCDFNFEKKFGVIGKDFIEVHHNHPVSIMEPNYRINIYRDLSPVCANCHRMLHKRNPPYSVCELQELIQKNISLKETR